MVCLDGIHKGLKDAPHLAIFLVGGLYGFEGGLPLSGAVVVWVWFHGVCVWRFV